jgi:hypothetical protein
VTDRLDGIVAFNIPGWLRPEMRVDLVHVRDGQTFRRGRQGTIAGWWADRSGIGVRVAWDDGHDRGAMSLAEIRPVDWREMGYGRRR